MPFYVSPERAATWNTLRQSRPDSWPWFEPFVVRKTLNPFKLFPPRSAAVTRADACSVCRRSRGLRGRALPQVHHVSKKRYTCRYTACTSIVHSPAGTKAAPASREWRLVRCAAGPGQCRGRPRGLRGRALPPRSMAPAPALSCAYRKVHVRLPEKGNSNSHGARPVHQIITMI